MPLPRRFRSFSLRTLMVLVTTACLAAWTWTLFQMRPEERLQTALLAISRDNPHADMTVFRGEGRVVVTIHGAKRISLGAAQAVSRARLICYIKWFGDGDPISMDRDAYLTLDTAFPSGLGEEPFQGGPSFSGVSCNRGAPEDFRSAEWGKREPWTPPAAPAP